jgi:hypothetical protein
VLRSAGRWALPLLAGLVLAHVLLRDRGWVHEWTWATYQYGFVTVLLGPLAAGVAAWEGTRLARARDLLVTGDRPLGCVALAWAGTTVWVLLAYAGGLLLVAGLVVAGGTRGWPPGAALLAPVPAAALLMAETAAGLAAGWWLRHLVAAPATAVACFLTTLWLYTTGPGALVVVGGATASLVGLVPRRSLEGLQVVWFLATALFLLVLASRTGGWGHRPGRWQAPAAGVLCVATIVPLLRQGEVFLIRESAGPAVCVGAAPRVCVAPGYADRAAATRALLLPYTRALARAGATPPAAFRQGVDPGLDDVGPLDRGLVLGNGGDAPTTVVAAWISKDCPLPERPRAYEAFLGLPAWLRWTVDHARDPAPDIPPIALAPASPAQDAWVRDSVAALRACAS